MHRPGHAGGAAAAADLQAAVMAAKGDLGPAVIGARRDPVDLVAAARAMLAGPELPLPVEGQALRVAVAVGPDHPAGAAGKGVAGRRRPVAGQPDDLAMQRVEILGRIEGAALADGQKDRAVTGLGQPAAEVAPAAAARRHLPDQPQIVQPVTLEPRRGNRGAGPLPALRLRETQQDGAGLGMVARHQDVEKTALPAGKDRRHPGNRDPRAIRTEAPQPSVALADHKAAAGQEGQAPGFVQPIGDPVDGQPAGAGRDLARGRRPGRQHQHKDHRDRPEHRRPLASFRRPAQSPV